MKNDVKQINKEFLLTVIGFLGVLILMGAVAVAAALFIPEAYAYIVYFLLLIAFILIGPRFRTKLERITNVAYIIKIRANQADPLPIQHMKLVRPIHEWIKENEFVRYVSNPSHDFYYKEQKDPIRRVFKKYLIEIVIVLNNKNDQFYLTEVDDEIQKLIDQMFKEKKRIFGMMITQIKRITKLDDHIKEQLKEIVFIRSKQGIISTINVGLHDPSNQAVMLYADKYSPSLYYRYHVDQIKKLI